MNGPNPATDPAFTTRVTVRLEMFEVYERRAGALSFLFATSDPTEAKKACTSPGDTIVHCWWVRERPDPEVRS